MQFIIQIKSSVINCCGFYRFIFCLTCTDGVLEIGREGEEISFLSWQDPDPLPIQYFSFSTWPGVDAKWFFDCPRDREETSISEVRLAKKSSKNNNSAPHVSNDLTFFSCYSSSFIIFNCSYVLLCARVSMMVDEIYIKANYYAIFHIPLLKFASSSPLFQIYSFCFLFRSRFLIF